MESQIPNNSGKRKVPLFPKVGKSSNALRFYPLKKNEIPKSRISRTRFLCGPKKNSRPHSRKTCEIRPLILRWKRHPRIMSPRTAAGQNGTTALKKWSIGVSPLLYKGIPGNSGFFWEKVFETHYLGHTRKLAIFLRLVQEPWSKRSKSRSKRSNSRENWLILAELRKNSYFGKRISVTASGGA